VGAAAGTFAAVPALASAKGAAFADKEEWVEQDALVNLEPMVAYVKDAARGEVAFLIGTQEVVRTDRRLVARLIAAMGQIE